MSPVLVRRNINSKDLQWSEEGSLPRRKKEIKKQQEANVLYCHRELYLSTKVVFRMMKLLRQKYMRRTYIFCADH